MAKLLQSAAELYRTRVQRDSSPRMKKSYNTTQDHDTGLLRSEYRVVNSPLTLQNSRKVAIKNLVFDKVLQIFTHCHTLVSVLCSSTLSFHLNEHLTPSPPGKACQQPALAVAENQHYIYNLLVSLLLLGIHILKITFWNAVLKIKLAGIFGHNFPYCLKKTEELQQQKNQTKPNNQRVTFC